ncbi:8598_t:CDS:1, partial [Entrophospora sp. SA101]
YEAFVGTLDGALLLIDDGCCCCVDEVDELDVGRRLIEVG